MSDRSDNTSGMIVGGAVLAAIAVAGAGMAVVRRMLGRAEQPPVAADDPADEA